MKNRTHRILRQITNLPQLSFRNASCNGARPIYTTARGFCNGARRNCTETANFRRHVGNKINGAAFVSVINF